MDITNKLSCYRKSPKNVIPAVFQSPKNVIPMS